jgi:nicotinamide-nucleotide amidase
MNLSSNSFVNDARELTCEILAVGTELLLGQVVDTNSTFIAQNLASAGVNCFYQTRVGDNLSRIEAALSLALSRADVVICCGGLGPTQDDITRHAITNVLRRPLVRDAALLDKVAAIFRERKREFADINQVQADLPEGARILSAMPGTAAGFLCVDKGKRVYALPGVPSEMKAMMTADVLPDIVAAAGGASHLVHHTFYTLGLGESAIAALLAERFLALEPGGNPTLAFLASDAVGVRVRVTAKARTAEQARALAQAEAERIRPLIKSAIYAETDEDNEAVSPESVLLQRLEKEGKTLAVAESLTGGLIGARLTAVPGASKVFRGGLVSYASDVKFDVLGVTPGPVVNEKTAAQMAIGVRKLLNADIALAATGVAGPDPQDDKPPGTVCLGLADADGVTTLTLTLGNRGREAVRQLSATEVFRLALFHR